MRIRTEEVARTLEQGLAPAWLIAGDETLLTGEAADAVRARARRDGYAGREVFYMDRWFEWSALHSACQSLSLFAERRVIELRMAAPRPGKEGGELLARLAAEPPPDTILLVTSDRIEREVHATAWFKAFEKHGVVAQSWPVAIAQLPQWITARAARHGLALEPDAAGLLAERVEGNLLAAHQEIEKLALLHAGGTLAAQDVQAAVANSARYDVFQLGEATLEGDAARSLRILDGLRAEGAEPPLVLWALCRELRALAEARRNPDAAAGYGRQAEKRAELLRRAVARTRGVALGPYFRAAARVDREIKGFARGDPWMSLTGLTAALAGAARPLLPSA
ncbi:MAG: DNA polymerase III subunit delta [Gammaproteobacteria bacterium]